MDIVLKKTVQLRCKQEKKNTKSTSKGVINISIKNKESSHVMSCANPSASIHVKSKVKEI